MLMGVFERLIGHVRGQAVAYLALFVALGGTGYAAVGLARHSIRPVMFDPQRIAGYVAAWAQIAPGGRVISASPFTPKVSLLGTCANDSLGCTVGVYWPRFKPGGFCTALATVQPIGGVVNGGPIPTPALPYGYVGATTLKQRKGFQITFESFGPKGEFLANQVAVAAICRPPSR